MAIKTYPKSRLHSMPENMIEPVARRFRVLGEPQRLRILQVLRSGARSVNEVVEAVGLSQPTISRHLQALYDSGLISRKRSGTSVTYFISDSMVFELCDLVCGGVERQARSELAGMAWPQSRRAEPRGRRH